MTDRAASPAPQAPFRPFAWPFGVFCFALALRLTYFFLLRGDKALSNILSLDSTYYLQRASEIHGGDLLGKGPFFQSGLLYAYGLALLDGNKQIIMLAQMVAGSLAATLAYYCGTFLNGRKTGLTAGLLYAACSVFIFDSANILFDSWVLFFIMLTVMGTYSAVATGKNYWYLVSGIALAVAGTSKPFVLVYLPLVLLLWVIPVHSPSKSSVAKAVLYLSAALMLVLAPISLRNWTVSRQISPFPATGGFTVYLGNNSQATGLLHIPKYLGVRNGERYAESTLAYPSQIMGHKTSYEEAGKFWMHKAVDFWRTDTKSALRLTLKKIALLLNNSEFDDNYSFELFSNRIRLLKFLPSAGYLIAPALLGLYFALKRWATSGPIVIMSSIYLAALPLILIVGRYRYPMLGLFTILAALALVEIASLLKAKNYLKAGACLAVILLAAILTSSSIASQQDLGDTREEVLSTLAAAYMDAGDPAAALEISEAGLANKNNGILFYQRGRALHMLGRDSEALASIRRATQLEPSLDEAHLLLEQISVRLKDPEEINLRQRLAGNQQSAENLFSLARYYFEHARYDRAIEQLKRLYVLRPDDESTIKLLAMSYLQRGKPTEGIEYLNLLAQRRPNNADIMANLAFAHFDSGNFELAEKTFLAARAIDPHHQLTHYGLGLIFRFSNRLAEARSEFQYFLAGENPQSVWYKEAQAQLTQINRLGN
jgi:tetratricopeptide (TPR) repeat protein